MSATEPPEGPEGPEGPGFLLIDSPCALHGKAALKAFMAEMQRYLNGPHRAQVLKKIKAARRELLVAEAIEKKMAARGHFFST